MQAQQDNGRLQASTDALTATCARLEAEMATKTGSWAEEKATFEEAVASRSIELEAIRARLSESEATVAESETRVREERGALETQLAAQSAQIGALRNELTGLGALLQDAGYSDDQVRNAAAASL